MEADDFEKTTQVFLSWLEKMGIVMSPSMVLKDLRSEKRGRGAGMITLPFYKFTGCMPLSIRVVTGHRTRDTYNVPRIHSTSSEFC